MTRNALLLLPTIKSWCTAVWQNDITACHTRYIHNQHWLSLCMCVCVFQLGSDGFGWFHLSTLVRRVAPRCQKKWPLPALHPVCSPSRHQSTSPLCPSGHYSSVCKRAIGKRPAARRQKAYFFRNFTWYLNMCLSNHMHKLYYWPPRMPALSQTDN